MYSCTHMVLDRVVVQCELVSGCDVFLARENSLVSTSDRREEYLLNTRKELRNTIAQASSRLLEGWGSCCLGDQIVGLISRAAARPGDWCCSADGADGFPPSINRGLRVARLVHRGCCYYTRE
ncbi:hypothetical protein R6Q59_031223 [Mikania micrantha]